MFLFFIVLFSIAVKGVISNRVSVLNWGYETVPSGLVFEHFPPNLFLTFFGKSIQRFSANIFENMHKKFLSVTF